MKKKWKAVNDPNKPKRPASAFFVFMEEFRKQFKKENPNNKYVSVVGTAGGVKWNAMSNAEKAPYVAKAIKMKAEYEKAIAAYNKKQEIASYEAKANKRKAANEKMVNHRRSDQSDEDISLEENIPVPSSDSQSTTKKSRTSDSTSNPTSSDAQKSSDEDSNADRPPQRQKQQSQLDRDEQFSKIVDAFREMCKTIEADYEYRKQRRDKKMELMKQRQKQKDYEFLVRPHGHLSGRELRVTLQMKDEIVKRWGWK